ncbi:A1 cistron-splicing factor [Thermothelomyces heterothallicus CBS 202.75]|uniref:A1 cistron-splicing factor n=1 Tax=Thermothelomyces heterothallicus CBS 202.75 TaxID=1149848 RepID=UPI003742AB5D
MISSQVGHAQATGAGGLHASGDGAPPRPAHLEKGDIFRTVGLPEELTIGLDAMAMATNKSLQGFREIPPGTHFLWVQLPGGVSRSGCWFITGSKGLLRVKEWDKYNEILGEPASSSGDARSQQDSLESIYSALKPYALHAHRDKSWTPMDNKDPIWARTPGSLWSILASAVSRQALIRITGKPDAQDFLVESTDGAKDDRPLAGQSPAGSGLNLLFTQDFRDLQVLDQGSMRDRVADTSSRIQSRLTTADQNSRITERDILADLQFTFLTGTHLSNSACLEHWWNLVLKMLLRAYGLVLSHPRLVRDFLTVLYAQLFYTEHYVASSSSQPDHQDEADDKGKKHGPSSDRAIFQYKPQYRGRLRQVLAEYRRRLNSLLEGLRGSTTADQEAVGRAFEDLEAWLWRKGWDLREGEGKQGSGSIKAVTVPDSEDEEDEQPVVVELDEQGREVGLLSFSD